jgi:hypothetical protein
MPKENKEHIKYIQDISKFIKESMCIDGEVEFFDKSSVWLQGKYLQGIHFVARIPSGESFI